MNEITKENEPNNEQPQPTLSNLQQRNLKKQYARLMNLIPTGKHKNQNGAKGAFGKSKFLNRK
jgi:hypothetical protein